VYTYTTEKIVPEILDDRKNSSRNDTCIDDGILRTVKTKTDVTLRGITTFTARLSFTVFQRYM